MHKGAKSSIVYPRTQFGFAHEGRIRAALDDGFILGVIEIRRTISALECRLIAGLLTMMVIGSFSLFGSALNEAFARIATHL